MDRLRFVYQKYYNLCPHLIIYEHGESGESMTLRKKWNLWQFIIIPGGAFFWFFMAFLFHDALVVICFLWVVVTYFISSRYRCPKCKRLLDLYSYEGLSMLTLHYWPSGLELNCPCCGALLE